jgi:2-alkyl-3-oxoalkanoate reductase
MNEPEKLSGNSGKPMQESNFPPETLLLITGATGLVGSHVAEEARKRNLRMRALVRAGSDTRLLEKWGVECVAAELNEPDTLGRACQKVTHVVHCAAKVGDWGPVDDYRSVNVRGLEHLLVALEAAGSLKQFVHISSLGVYEGRDHFGTDETVEPTTVGIDGYTLTKVEAEKLVLWHVQNRKLPGVVLRPGFIYGPRDRTVLPKLLERLKAGQVKYFGTGEQKMNNTFVGNLVEAIFVVLTRPESVGQVYNVTDGQLVSKRDFISTVATLAGYEVPKAAVPLGVARFLTRLSETIYRWLGKKEAPLLSAAKFKFLGLNLEFSIDKARRELGYAPHVSFQEGMQRTIEWFREQGTLKA